MAPRTLVLDMAACSSVFERARATDLLILCFGIALGFLIYAVVDALIARWSAASERRRHRRGLPAITRRTCVFRADTEALPPPPYASDSKV